MDWITDCNVKESEKRAFIDENRDFFKQDDTRAEAWRKYFIKKSLSLHPDKGGDPEEMKRLNHNNDIAKKCIAWYNDTRKTKSQSSSSSSSSSSESARENQQAESARYEAEKRRAEQRRREDEAARREAENQRAEAARREAERQREAQRRREEEAARQRAQEAARREANRMREEEYRREALRKKAEEDARRQEAYRRESARRMNGESSSREEMRQKLEKAALDRMKKGSANRESASSEARRREPEQRTRTENREPDTTEYDAQETFFIDEYNTLYLGRQHARSGVQKIAMCSLQGNSFVCFSNEGSLAKRPGAMKHRGNIRIDNASMQQVPLLMNRMIDSYFNDDTFDMQNVARDIAKIVWSQYNAMDSNVDSRYVVPFGDYEEADLIYSTLFV